MDNIYDEINAACKAAGTNLTKVCREANVDRSTLTRWKTEDPKSIRIYRRLLATISTVPKLKTSGDEVVC